MTMILRPLLPLLMLIPVIALASASYSAVPIQAGAVVRTEMTRAPLTAADTLRRQQADVPRIFTVSVQRCVRTGNRMVC
jgi:hypothetical protein